MNLEPQYAFVDAYGDPNLDVSKGGVSTCFIITAIIVEHDHLVELERDADEIRKIHFRTGEMKSKNVGSNDERRRKILKDIAGLDFKFYSIIIDKREVWESSGLIYREPFIKFTHGLLYRKLYRTFPEMFIISDEYGGRSFMEGFQKYVNENHVPDLFIRAEFGFVASHEQPIVQLADFISGTLARHFDPKKSTTVSKDFMNILLNRTLLIDTWPPISHPSTNKSWITKGNDFDNLICELALYKASNFIEENMDTKDEVITDQLEALKYLLYHFRYVNSKRYIFTEQLKRILNQVSPNKVTTHYLRSKVIAKLRDKGVIIASSPKGYKIPDSEQDLYDFVGQMSGQIGPMLSRLKKAREDILLRVSAN
ncbi:hypothetical protein CEE37_01925 [candidate division LCP-89 bacterium B3_LCP]|uniref:DUF3800 domain-containing protein n=1 Tax=candidate division LCP-89 bacterium B3_LCP TaxID=2012998 RepID=A0A532V5I9_UNCL8|nr:MAG: hypothetical protein CEE37_01925 [candidate division LCP-89 bacterium B3_LCP]